MLGLSEGEDEEESEEEEEEEEFKLPPALQRQILASDDEEPSEKGATHFCILLFVFIVKTLETFILEVSDKAWGRKKKTFYAVEGIVFCKSR